MSTGDRADLVLVGRIATLAGDHGPGWAEAVAIAGGRVVAAGSRAAVDALAGSGTRTVTLASDEVAIPGIIDAHLHLAEAALARTRVDLEGAESIAELVARVQDACDGVAAGSWIEGAGWDADRLGRWPTADDLEAAAPGCLVALWAHDHHALLASAAGLAMAGIGDDRPDPDGGVIRRDPTGRATGVLHERAATLVTGLVPLPDVDEVERALRPFLRELLALGVTGVHDPGSLSAPTGLGASIGAYRRLASRGDLGVRVHAAIRSEQLRAAADAGLRSGAPLGPDPLDRLRMGWLKVFADGTLGSRTAALLEPLEVRPGEAPPPNGGYGVWLTPPEELRELVGIAAASGIAVQVHAIGDAAVRASLDALAPTTGATPLMPRIEHAQLVADADLPRFAALGIAASMQPIHIRSDEEAARRLWGARVGTRAYPLGRIARTGAVVAIGTDAPVEPPDPWPGIACAVTRMAPSWSPGTPALGPGNAIDLWRAIRAACLDPALSAGERDRGRLVAGHHADVVVIPALAVAEPVEVGGALWHARPRLVLVDGAVAAGDAG